MSLRAPLLAFIALLALTACQTNTLTSPRLAAHTIRPNHQALAAAHTAGFDTVVQLFPWREVEPTRAQFHWEVTDQIVAGAEYYNLDLIVRLDQHPAWASEVDLALNAPPDRLQDYYNFVYRVAVRYRGRIKAYIIWNEPNLAIEWGDQRPDATAFTALLKEGYRAVKAADPEALVVSAGLAPTNSNDTTAMDERLFLEEMYQAGAGAYFEVLGAHAYSFGQAPNAPESDSEHPAFRRVAELREIMVEHGDVAKPVWITEMGWTVEPPAGQSDIGVSLEQQANYLVEALELIRREWPWVELVAIWNLSQPQPDDSFGGYSVLDFSGKPRPAYVALQQAAGSRTGPVPARITQPDQVSILAQDTTIHLGDSELLPPWWPLFGGHNPSLTWTGGFYLIDPGSTDWKLYLESMHQNEAGNIILINDNPFPSSLPQQDFTRRWLAVQFLIPASLLRPGYNEITFTSVRLLPDAQHDGFVWDDFQVRNIRLVRANENSQERTFNMFDLTFVLIVAATAVNGILAGASLDQSIKQLPARHRIGVAAYATYTQAGDLGNGLIWYASIGIGAALLVIVAALAAFFQEVSSTQAIPIYIAAVLSVLHSLVTTQAAPTLHSQRQYGNDEAALAAIFNRFERWQTLRAFLQVLTFVILLWAMIVYRQE